jgi:hypothetical protein
MENGLKVRIALGPCSPVAEKVGRTPRSSMRAEVALDDHDAQSPRMAAVRVQSGFAGER